MNKILRVLLVALLVFSTSEALAQKKKPKPKVPAFVIVAPEEIYVVEVMIPSPKKKKKKIPVSVQCREGTPGTSKQAADGLRFTSYLAQIKKLKKAKVPNQAKIRRLSQINRGGKEQCKISPVAPPTSSLDKYTGPFGYTEAQLLYSRFAFGATDAEISEAVAAGLDATVAKLTTYIATPEVDAIEQSLRCDAKLPDEPEKKVCDSNDVNDLSMTGIRYGIYYRMLNAPNRFFDKMFMFLHDERAAVSSDVLEECERHAAITYLNKVRSAAITGNYTQYLYDMNSDHLAHLRWLSGASNHFAGPGSIPNEDYGREFLELVTIGPNARDGTPNYNDYDIVQSALVFTGNNIQKFKVNDKWVCHAAFVPGLHAPGAFTLFYGTPHEITASTPDELVTGILKHPRLAEHLAEDLWQEFINGTPTQSGIADLAKLIRDNNYNLMPVMQKIMTSQALYDPKSAKTLIKHPLELMMGFLVSSGVPMSLKGMDDWLAKMGQRPMRPPTVFGWNERNLAGEAFVVEWRNTLVELLKQSDQWYAERGYSFFNRFLLDLPETASPSKLAIARVSSSLGVTLNEGQIETLNTYMNYDLEACSNPSQCGGLDYKLKPKGFFPDPESDTISKVRGALYIIASLDDYRLK